MNTACPVLWQRRSGFLFACSLWLLVWVATVSFTSSAQQSPTQSPESRSRFQRTVEYLQSASTELQREFAAVAITKLARAYFAEVEIARSEIRAAGKDAGLYAWSIAVNRFAGQLPLLLEDLELGFPVRLTTDVGKFLAITVADRTVILSVPRPSQQSVFEQEILMDFCITHDCEKFTPSGDEPKPILLATSLVRPQWSFTERDWACSYRGIKIRFQSEKNLANSRLVCEQFLQEVLTLIDEMAWQRGHAVSIEWDKLSIQATPRRPGHVVQLNSAGDSILVTIPVLYSSPGLLEDILPWMQLRLEGQQEAEIELDAAHYGWENP